MTVHFGDCRDVMRAMIERKERVQMCVTSPPYWGLRDYGVDNQIGLEISPSEFVDTLVSVFALVHELLDDDGTLWLNLGDSYSSGGRGSRDTKTHNKGNSGAAQAHRPPSGLRPKCLIGIPWRVALALQEWGWYLRQDIIWHKPNPMPESVRDRCTKAHEYIFLLSKSESYHFDSEAIAEPAIYGNNGSQFHTGKTAEHQLGRTSKKRGDFNGKTNSLKGREAFRAIRDTRNKRSVWTVPTKPYSGAHFAVFPPELIEPCILAGSRGGGTVLDPFFGSGTTGQVCNSLGRKHIGIELNPDYEPLQRERTAQQGLQL